MAKKALIDSCFGFQVGATLHAQACGYDLYIVSKKDDEAEYNEDCAKILAQMSFFCPTIQVVPFAECEAARDNYYNFVPNLLEQKISDYEIRQMANTRIIPQDTDGLPAFKEYSDHRINVLLVFDKLVSDEQAGKTAAQQSLGQEFFDYIRSSNVRAILGQHYNKVTDLANIMALRDNFPLSIPGDKEHPELLGIRGVLHKQYYHLYRQVDLVIGIAGTHSWLSMALFPDTPHIVLSPVGLKDNWPRIAEIYRSQGKPMFSVEFDKENLAKAQMKSKLLFENLLEKIRYNK